MFNDWFTIGPFTVHGYGVMVAIGILSALFLGERICKKKGLDADNVDNMVLFTVLIGYIFSKITYCLTIFDEFIKDPSIAFKSGGWVVYGGIIGGLFGMWLYCKYKKYDVLAYLNALAPCVALAQGFGRIGCFLAGCCYGIETDLPIGVHFPAGSLGPSPDMSVLPTQLIMAIGDFIIFYLLYHNLFKGKHPEKTAAYYLILYSIGRFLIEFIRGDAQRGFIGPLSTSQFISIFILLLGIFFLKKESDEPIPHN